MARSATARRHAVLPAALTALALLLACTAPASSQQAGLPSGDGSSMSAPLKVRTLDFAAVRGCGGKASLPGGLDECAIRGIISPGQL